MATYRIMIEFRQQSVIALISGESAEQAVQKALARYDGKRLAKADGAYPFVVQPTTRLAADF